MINKRACFLASVVLVLGFSTLEAQSLPAYWGDLKNGNYTVGFKSICVFDAARTYDLTCGDSTVVLGNKSVGRPILINMWYPSVKDKTPALKVKEFFDFPDNENTKVFFSKLKDFQYEYSRFYAIDQNLKENDFSLKGDTTRAGRERLRKALFESYINAATISHRNAKAIAGDFPVIIYHQGLGGTIDGNYLFLEYLASNGYIVISSAFQVTDGGGYGPGWFTGVGSYEDTFADFSFIINYCKQNNISKSKKIFLSGASYGGNCSVTYIGEGNKNVDGLIALDSDYGYDLNISFAEKFNPFVKGKFKFYNNVSMFCVGRSAAHFRLLDSLSQSRRYFLTISDMAHNDFAAQGAIGKFYFAPYAAQKEKFELIHKNYLRMCAAILKYLDGYSKSGKGLEKKEITLYPGWKMEASKPGEKSSLNARFDPSKSNCPTISQFIDIINDKGLEEMKMIYLKCPEKVSEEVLTDVFEYLYESDSLKALPYVIWLDEIGMAEKNLYKIYSTVYRLSFWNYGNGYHLEKAVPFYQWMIDKYSDNKYGYLGMALFAFSTGKSDAGAFCKKVMEIDPDYLKTKGSFADEFIKEKIEKCLEKK